MAAMTSPRRLVSENSGRSSRSESISLFSEQAKEALSMEIMIHEPIRSGFLLKHCNDHYCSENMRFVMEVDRFRDLFHVDKITWGKKTYKQLDVEQNIGVFDQAESKSERIYASSLKDEDFFREDLWPSSRLPFASVRGAIDYIWSQFLAEDAPFWICIPSRVLVNTIKRLRNVHIYGREVFAECLVDPVTTIKKDILPRFLVSEDCRNMKALLAALDPLPCANMLKLSRPTHIIYTRYSLAELEQNKVQFTLDDLCDDRILYTEFMRYLEQRVSTENLKCVRAVRIFQELIQDPASHAAGVEYAHTVYKFFVCPGSAYNVSLSHTHLKEVMRALATPHPAMFSQVEVSALSALRTHFDMYVLTREYAGLCRVVLQHKESGILSVLATSGSSGRGKGEGEGTSGRMNLSLSTIIKNTCFPG
eukprot:gene35273-42738_t